VGSVSEFSGQHSIIGLDTSVFIYHFEMAIHYLPATTVVLENLVSDEFKGLTSVVTITEINVRPYALGRYDLADQYASTLSRIPNLSLVNINVTIAHRAAEFRGRYNILTPDALQIAACLEEGATGFITNDRRLTRVRELDVLVLADTDDVQGRA